MLDHVFSPITINGMQLKNRMVVTPMVTDYCNEDGTATEKWLAYHEEKAKGGFGLIITEDYSVTPDGHGYKATAGLKDAGIAYSVIGDANGNKEAGDAIREAFLLCRAL